MAGLVIVAHAPLATALLAVARHVFPDRAGNLVTVDVLPDWTVDQVEQAVRDAIARAAPGVAAGQPPAESLVLTDVFGATPCNAAQRVAEGLRVRLVAGVNVPMLWRALAYAHLPLDELVERALAGGAQGVMPASPQKPQDQSLHSAAHDPSHRHHQQ